MNIVQAAYKVRVVYSDDSIQFLGLGYSSAWLCPCSSEYKGWYREYWFHHINVADGSRLDIDFLTFVKGEYLCLVSGIATPSAQWMEWSSWDFGKLRYCETDLFPPPCKGSVCLFEVWSPKNLYEVLPLNHLCERSACEPLYRDSLFPKMQTMQQTSCKKCIQLTWIDSVRIRRFIEQFWH